MLLRKHWKTYFSIGIDRGYSLYRKENMLANRINIVMLCVMIALNGVMVFMRFIEGTQMGYGSLRLLLILAINLANIWLARRRLFTLFKLSLIFAPVFVFFIFTSMVGFVEEESFLYYPYALIAFSIIPQLILDIKRERVLYVTSLIFFLLLVGFIDNILLLFSDTSFEILPIINRIYVFYKIAPITIFIFIHLSIYYLRGINTHFERKVETTNHELESALEELKVTQNQLIQSEKMASLGVLTSGVAHEINNPLNFIHGGIIGLERYLTDSQQINDKSVTTYVHAIKTGVNRISHIVTSLNRYNRDSKFQREPCNINAILDECLLGLEPQFSERIGILKQYTQEDVRILGNIRELYHVFQNILSNAFQSIDNEGTIIITTIRHNTHLLIDINDSGQGIHPNDIGKIFDPFYTTKEPGKGTGLGIPISYAILKEHKGELYYRSEPGKGTTATIKLPAM